MSDALSFITSERESLSESLNAATDWLDRHPSPTPQPRPTSHVPTPLASMDGRSGDERILWAKQNLRGNIESLANKVTELKGKLGGNEEEIGHEYFSGGEGWSGRVSPVSPGVVGGGGGRRRSPTPSVAPRGEEYTRNGTKLFGSGWGTPRSQRTAFQATGGESNYVGDDTTRLMSRMNAEVKNERSNISSEMRRYAIRETEVKLNDMRRGHVEELDKVLGETIVNVGGQLVQQDGRQIAQLQQALEAKRDEMIANSREDIYAQLEVALRTMEKSREGNETRFVNDAETLARAELERRLLSRERELRMEAAKRELNHNVQSRMQQISEDNRRETTRVFGELAQALEIGANKNLQALKETKTNERQTKEAHLIAHSEKVVGEAMEQLAGELLEAERVELNDIRTKSEADRVELMNRTRLDGSEALTRALEAEKTRLRNRKEDAVQELRREMQGQAMSELQELTEALDFDLKTAETLMIDSVKGGLTSSLQAASEEHTSRDVVDQGVLEGLKRKLRVRQLALMKELPKFVEGNRLRVFGETRAGSAEFETTEKDLEEIDSNVTSGRTNLALHVLQEQYEKLEKRQEQVGRVLGDTGSEIRALRKELKSVDEDTYGLYYGGTGRENPNMSTDGTKVDVIENILNHSFRTVDRDAVGRGERVGEGDVENAPGTCQNCQKLYMMNGELLKEINA